MLASTLIVASIGLFRGVNAWGVLGHATVGYIAQNYVSDDTKSWSVVIFVEWPPLKGLSH